MTTSPLTVKGLELTGASLGGIETHLCVPQLRLTIDVGRGPRELVRCEHMALTHTHIDHAAGLPYLVAMRSFFRLSPPKVYVPAQMKDEVRDLIEAWNRLQRIESPFDLVPMMPGDTVPLKKGFELTAFRTRHVVPSLGYTVTKRVDKLAPEYQGRPGAELRVLKGQGVEITTSQREPLISVTGDTLPEVIDEHSALMDSEVVVMECTFLDDTKPYEAARHGGHIHLDDLMSRVERLTCKRLVLSHFSQIHAWADIPALLAPLAARVDGEVWAWPTGRGRDPIRITPG